MRLIQEINGEDGIKENRRVRVRATEEGKGKEWEGSKKGITHQELFSPRQLQAQPCFRWQKCLPRDAQGLLLLLSELHSFHAHQSTLSQH